MFEVRAKGDVVGPLGMNHRRAWGQRLLRIRDYRQKLIFHANQIERVRSRIALLGDYGCDSLADVTDFIGCEHVVFGNPERLIAAAGRQGADLIFDLRSRDDGDDTRMRSEEHTSELQS